MSATSRRRVVAVRLLTSLLAALVAAAGCGFVGGTRAAPPGEVTGSTTPSAAPAPESTFGPDTFERSGRSSQIRLTLPPGGTAEPYPLIVALHSLYHDGSEPQTTWGLDELALSEGFAVAYPDGLNQSWNAGTCCGLAAATGADDVAWLRSLIAHLKSRYPIDSRRVSIIGLSNGGMLAYRYACEHGDELAGFVAVSASLQTVTCVPPAPLTTVEIHGGMDGHVPYAGALWSEVLQTGITPVDVSLAPFRAIAGCPPPNRPGDTTSTGADGRPVGTSSPAQPGTASAAGTTASGTTATDAGTPGATELSGPMELNPAPIVTTPVALRHETRCSSSARLVQYIIPALAHGWPARTGPGAFNTAAVLWDVLRDARSASTVPLH